MSDDMTIEASAERDGEVTLSTGVVIRGREIPPEVTRRAYMRARKTEPKMPMWHNPDKGRDEPNPNDPDYIEAVRQHWREAGEYMGNALLMYGVELVSVPDGFPTQDSPEWLEELALSNIASGTSTIARWFDWLTIKAAPTRADRDVMFAAAGRASGTLEADVQAETKSV